MDRPSQAKKVFKKLRPLYPKPRTALHYKTPFQLLVAVILSAQCTDKKVNEVTPPIFAKYRTAQDFARIPLTRLAKMVKPTGFYVSKSKAVSVTAKLVSTKFGNRVPLTMDELLALRGVARKTANVVLGELTGAAPGIVVDTHVRRLSQRLGLTTQNDPVKIERELMELVPQKDWVVFSHLLILHGRSICEAKKPKCDECVLNTICPAAFTFQHFQKHP